MKYEVRITDENGATLFIARDGIENTLDALREWMRQNIEAAQHRVQADGSAESADTAPELPPCLTDFTNLLGRR
jgi:hypothetical protein